MELSRIGHITNIAMFILESLNTLSHSYVRLVVVILTNLLTLGRYIDSIPQL